MTQNQAWSTVQCGFITCIIAFSAALSMTGCGGGSPSFQPPRQLTSLTVQPSNGDAIVPAGTLPFNATGTYNEAPISQANMTVLWVSSKFTCGDHRFQYWPGDLRGHWRPGYHYCLRSRKRGDKGLGNAELCGFAAGPPWQLSCGQR
jgi:hypothetical protein